MIDRAIDHDQAIILTAELLKGAQEQQDERAKDILDQIVQTALKNSTLIASYGAMDVAAKRVQITIRK